MGATTLSIVVPVHNEQEQVVALADAVRQVLAGRAFEILFVDDGSSDGTWEAVCELHQQDAHVGGVRLTRNFGKEAAVWTGIETALGDAVVVMDVDLQHPPALLPGMIELWESGRWKIVEAHKVQRAREPWWYRMLSAVFYRILQAGTGVDFRGSTDFKLIDRTVVDLLGTFPERSTFFRGLTAWTGVPRASIDFEVPAAHRATRWTLSGLMRFSVATITSFTPWPLVVVALAGVAFALFAAILGIQTLYMFFSGRAVTGFTTVILLMLIVGAAIMFGLAVLGLYVSRLFEEVKARPRSIRAAVLPPEWPGRANTDVASGPPAG